MYLQNARKHRDNGEILEAERNYVEAIVIVEHQLDKYHELVICIEDECRQMLYAHYSSNRKI